MTLLSICIPVFGHSPGSQAAVIDSVRQMLGNARDDFQILIGDFSSDTEPLSRFASQQSDPRLTVMSPGPASGELAAAASKAACWNWMVPHTRGEWICLIEASDYADPDICAVLEATLKRVPQADALSWSRAGYVWLEQRARDARSPGSAPAAVSTCPSRRT
ncbi:glycosyltransferase [Hoeflea alexandrii]|uniref:glycosyltransferase family 2 protein n=1 Tax=Hoeflea alexandrii TaxID=288436 RepID=UPI002271CEB7|nr:glycosyltransferase [Hoeflea alexandrii]MCY0152680.1 glycosyltransferase [Hoeflea alexandrii]